MIVDLTAGIVRILKPDGTTAGTGFVVSDDGLIATCSHVLQSEESQERGDPRPEYVDLILRATGDRRRARVEPDWWRPADAEDVAILRLEGALPEGVLPCHWVPPATPLAIQDIRLPNWHGGRLPPASVRRWCWVTLPTVWVGLE